MKKRFQGGPGSLELGERGRGIQGPAEFAIGAKGPGHAPETFGIWRGRCESEPGMGVQMRAQKTS